MKVVLLLVLLFTPVFGQFTYDPKTKTASFEGVDTVFVNGVRVPYLIEFCYDTLPVNLSVLFDNSGSLDGEFKPPHSALDFEKDLVKRLIQFPDSVIVATGNTVNAVIPESAIDAVIPTGGTDIYNMLTGVSGVLENAKLLPKKRIACLVTDGWDSPFRTMAQINAIIDTCNKYEIKFYSFIVNSVWVSTSVQVGLKIISDQTGGICFDKVDSFDVLQKIADSVSSHSHKYPCKIKFLLDSCEREWHIQIGLFDTTLQNPSYYLTFKATAPDTLILGCEDSTITINHHWETNCNYWDSNYAARVTQSGYYLGEWIEVIRGHGDTAYSCPDTLFGDTCKFQEFTITRTITNCDSTQADSLTFPYNANPYQAFDSIFTIVFISQYEGTLSFDSEHFISVSICDTGIFYVPISNSGCLPAGVSIKGSGAFTSSDSITIGPYSTDSVKVIYYPSGRDTSVFLFNGTRVYFYGVGYDTSWTERPDTIRFSRSVCDSAPVAYSVLTISCDTTVSELHYTPTLEKGSYSDLADGVVFIYTVYDSIRTEEYLDSCGSGYTLTIGCDTVITLYPLVIDTVHVYISHEHLDTSRVKITSLWPVVSNTDLLVHEYGDIWRFYLGKDSLAIVTPIVPEKPCTVYIIHPDTIYYQSWCGDELIKGLLNQTTFRIYPNPSTGAFKIEPEPESIAAYFESKLIWTGIGTFCPERSGVYFIIADGVVLRLVVVR